MSISIASPDVARRRPTRRSSAHGIRDVDMPQRRHSIPLDELAAEFARWNYRQDRAKDDYYRRPLERR